jgi:nitrogen regulation protein NR(I)
MTTSSVLLIEDDRVIAESLTAVLVEEGYRVSHISRGDEGLRRGREGGFDVVLCDVKLPGLSGLDLVRELHSAAPQVPIILMTAHGTCETAIEAMKHGAYEYLLKPFDMAELLELLARAVSCSRLMQEPVHLGLPHAPGPALVGQSRKMQEVFKHIGRLAAKPVSVLIRGETGTGKELVARALYQHSERAAKPFVAINCAAIPETLLESELFGHERGAFTGAVERRIGRFEQAHEGTVFLDEIGDMSPGTQAKLLRVLQERSIQRLGGRETLSVDVRVIAATHRDLENAITRQTFREDLFYRLNVATIHLPPLRERIEDLEPLVSYFLNRYGPELGNVQPALDPAILEVLREHPWPGNIRELENVIRKALLHAQGFALGSEHIRVALHSARRDTVAGLPAAEPSIRQAVAALLAQAQRDDRGEVRDSLLTAVDRELFSQAIRLARGNQARAARWIGVSRITLREKLQQFGIPVHEEKEGDAAQL